MKEQKASLTLAGTSVSLIFLDLGTPSTSQFTSGNDGTATNSFGANSSACVRVNDPDQNANSSVAEILSAVVTSSSGDSEVVVMTETGTNTGVFTACITTSTNSGAGTNNGVLLAPVGALLTLSYTDPNDSSDTSSATATIQPPPGVPGVLASKTLIAPANGQAVVGDTVQFNLQVVNSGSTVLSSLSITDAFPSSRLSFTSATVPPDVMNASFVAWTNWKVFHLVNPSTRGTTYYVRWLVAGKEFTEPFKGKALSDGFLADLVAAARKVRRSTSRPVCPCRRCAARAKKCPGTNSPVRSRT